MKNSEQLSLYFAKQLPALLSEHPTFKFIGLKIQETSEQIALHSIYIEKDENVEEFPFRALVRVAEWDGKSEEEEFFFEALTAECLMDKLQCFDKAGSFVFFETPELVDIGTVNMSPQAMFCTLFQELGEFDENVSMQDATELKMKSIAMLNQLVARLE
jgi:hypothetical protein